jgi:BlaI family transcriptional regulator, penicillinase repressor
MSGEKDLSRRERQIMDVLFKLKEADVLGIQSALPKAPGGMAIRKMLSILESKGQVSRRKEGRKFVYRPSQSPRKAGNHAFRHLLTTFFGGSVEQALATHLQDPNTELTNEQCARIVEMIKSARQTKPRK